MTMMTMMMMTEEVLGGFDAVMQWRY